MKFLIFSFFLSLIFLMLFFMIMKVSKLNFKTLSTFECGFTSYFFSRFSFSVHYFYISVIFLFLDLELAVAMPFFLSPSHQINIFMGLSFFLLALLLGLLEEWVGGKLEWSF